MIKFYGFAFINKRLIFYFIITKRERGSKITLTLFIGPRVIKNSIGFNIGIELYSHSNI